MSDTKTAKSLWLGTWSLGGEGFGKQDLRESHRVLETAFELGIRHFDTANIYAHGQSEELLGKTLKLHRKDIHIATKGGLEWSNGTVRHNASYDALKEHLESSLKRLQTDYIDTYFLHWPDPKVPIEESLDALRRLKDSGLMKDWRISNFNPHQLSHIEPHSQRLHQVHHNPIHRNDSVLEAGQKDRRCRHLITSPLEQGLLGTTKSAEGLLHLGKRDLRRRNPHFSDPSSLKLAETFRNHARESDLSHFGYLCKWYEQFSDIEAIVIGPRLVTQLYSIFKGFQKLQACGNSSGAPSSISTRRFE